VTSCTYLLSNNCKNFFWNRNNKNNENQ